MDHSTTHIIGDSLLMWIYNDHMAISAKETASIYPLFGADIDRHSHAAQVYHKQWCQKNNYSWLSQQHNVKPKHNTLQLSVLVSGLIRQKFPTSSIFMSSIISPCYGFQRCLSDMDNQKTYKFCLENNPDVHQQPLFHFTFRCFKENDVQGSNIWF